MSFAMSLMLLVAPQEPASANDPGDKAFSGLTACRAINGETERLACYDREVASLESALAAGDVVALDRNEVRTARRSLFGFAAPIVRIFSGREEPTTTEKVDIDLLETTIKSARQLPRGRWRIELEDGAVWTQTDDRRLAIYPAPGQAVIIRKAALGSFLANIAGQVAIRVQRQQ